MSQEKKPVQLVIATGNIHKVREYKTLLQEFTNLDILSLRDFPAYQIPEETGTSFKENAILKAQKAALELNLWVLADDSGLVVPALNGGPGLFSARYAGEKASDADNRKKLLVSMKHLKETARTAYFECCIAIASPKELKKCVCASVEGSISTVEKGGGGFGYDPLFVKTDYNKTFAELEESLKNKISHRRKALDKTMSYLQGLSLETV